MAHAVVVIQRDHRTNIPTQLDLIRLGFPPPWDAMDRYMGAFWTSGASNRPKTWWTPEAPSDNYMIVQPKQGVFQCTIEQFQPEVPRSNIVRADPTHLVGIPPGCVLTVEQINPQYLKYGADGMGCLWLARTRTEADRWPA